MMAASDPVPAAAVKAVELYCETRVPAELRDEVEIACRKRGKSITIVDRRAPWNLELAGAEWTELKVAQLRFDPDSSRWSLHWRDSSERWHPYDGIAPSERIDDLLAEIEADPTAIFWG